MKFTFKTEQPTGRYRSFFSASHDIKLGGVVCGSIDDETPHTVKFMKWKDDIMEDGNPNCQWKWVRLKRKFSSVFEAKEFVKENSEEIQSQIKVFIQHET